MADLLAPARLDRECAAFARYLTGQSITEYVSGKYRDAHASQPALAGGASGALDRVLLWAARTHGAGAWLVDTYTAVFFKRALVRKKWILLVAILETTAPTAGIFDVPDGGGLAGGVARLGWRGLTFLLGLGLSSVVFLPIHLLSSVTSGRDARRL